MLFNIINSIFMVKLNDVFIPSKNRTVYLQQIAQVQSRKISCSATGFFLLALKRKFIWEITFISQADEYKIIDYHAPGYNVSVNCS